MKINYIKASNFLSYGNDPPLHIDFTKLGNIVCIKGENRDQGEGASNGSGKSAILDAITYAFYGELVKNLNHGQAINIQAKSKLEVEVGFELDGHSYVINRRRKKDELYLYVDGTLQQLGGMPDTQKAINRIIRLNYNAFVNIVCFGQHNAKPFLMCTAAEKREIAESLLSLEKYNKFCDAAKKKKNALLQKLEVATALYQKSGAAVVTGTKQIENIVNQQSDWRSSQLNTIDRIKVQITRAKAEMAGLNTNSSDSFEQVDLVEGEIVEKTKQRNMMSEAIREAEAKQAKVRDDRQTLVLSGKEIAYAVNKAEREIGELQSQMRALNTANGTKCKVCYGTVNKENFRHVISHNESEIARLTAELAAGQAKAEELKGKIAKCDRALTAIAEAVDGAKIRELSVVRTIRELESKRAQLAAMFQKNADAAALIIEQKIVTLSDQLVQKQNELEAGDPYGPILDTLREELKESEKKSDEHRAEVTALTEEVPYYDFWIAGFGDKGVRSFVIDEVVPLLNSKINYWLQFLIDNKITVKFNNELVETLERNPPDGDPFVHNAMSGGEHQRISLGISQGFANVNALTANNCPSLVCLDEVGTNLDRPGIQAVFNMICELARERQVLVTTHDPDLLELLSGYDTITVIKEKGLSRIK